MKRILLLIVFSKSVFAQAQNVGIGTANPTRAKLEVHGGVDATSAIFGGESSGISLQRNLPGIGFNTYHNGAQRYLSNGYGGILSFDHNNGLLTLDMYASGTANNNAFFGVRAMTFNNLGGMSLGTFNAPTVTLEVARGSFAEGTAKLHGSTHISYFNKGAKEDTYIRAGLDNGTVHINDIPGGYTILHGKVGVNGGAVFDYPFEILQTNGRGLEITQANGFDRWGFSVLGTNLNLQYRGSFKGQYSVSDGTYSSASDSRLKTNVQALPALLPKLMQLKPVDYEMVYDNPSHQKTIGFVAQEVKRLFPELVTVMKDSTHGYKNIPDLHTLNYSGFGVIAVKAIQEQQALIEQLKTEVAELKKAVGALRKE